MWLVKFNHGIQLGLRALGGALIRLHDCVSKQKQGATDSGLDRAAAAAAAAGT